MESSMHPSQETDGAPGSETLQSSVCSVCQGLFDKDHRRSYILERGPHERFGTDDEHECCRICTIIGKNIWQLRIGDGAKIYAAIQARKYAGLVAGPQVVQPDVDLQAATDLADIGKQERLLDITKLYDHAKGWILIRHYFDFEAQGRFFGQVEAKIHYLTDHKGLFGLHKVSSPLCTLKHFYSPYDFTDPDLEHRPSKDLLSGPHIKLIDSWRRVCENNHNSCNKFSQGQILPRRVLEIMDLSDKKTGVRLVENEDETRGAYACLSYCWGGSQAGQAKSSNILSYLDGIPLDDLPSTVVDAIRLCHQLGIRYLWVDRLCIIQDDEKDWSEQASRMCEVYSRSSLTISVPLCKQSSESFLGRRRLGFQEQDKFITIPHDHPTEKSMSWISEEHFSRAFRPWFLEENWKGFTSSNNYSQNRWLERGWTFQEWMLSPRVLHIDSLTLWDCFDGYANEIFRREMETPYLFRNLTDPRNTISWDLIVQEYSARQLTERKDRLPALAGLAIQYSKATGYTYLAGLWREGLLRSLLWTRPEDSDEFEYAEPDDKYAPSWSWASLNESVCYDISILGKDFIEKASVLDTLCQYYPPNSCSTVEEAWIDIKGRVGTVTATSHDGITARHTDSIVEGMRWEIELDYDITFWDDAIRQRSVFVLLIGSVEDCTSGLVIQQCEDEGEHQCYRRLGIAWYTYSLPDGVPSGTGLEWETRIVRLI